MVPDPLEGPRQLLPQALGRAAGRRSNRRPRLIVQPANQQVQLIRRTKLLEDRIQELLVIHGLQTDPESTRSLGASTSSTSRRVTLSRRARFATLSRTIALSSFCNCSG